MRLARGSRLSSTPLFCCYRPDTVTARRVGVTAELAITLPVPSCGCTWPQAGGPGTWICVSKPVDRACATDESELLSLPVSTRHSATSVAPFQLAQTVVELRPTAVAARGGSAGNAPCQGNLNARYVSSPVGCRIASNATSPVGVNSVMYAFAPPQPTMRLPFGSVL